MSSVKTLTPPGAVTPTGTWNVGARAGDFVFVAGMRGIDPKTNRPCATPSASSCTSPTCPGSGPS